MNIARRSFALTREAEEYLQDLADELAVPESRYEAAERSYKSLGEWLHREASSVCRFDPQVYVQGSFRLGTTIKPLNEAEDYDVDSVCELRNLTKADLTQQQLKDMLGVEVEAYRRAQSMLNPMREGRRCWILDYADGAQFHMDIVPSLPNALGQRLLLEARGFDARWASTAIVITDNKHPYYQVPSDEWPRSNPKGYADWFKSRMAGIFEKRRRQIAEGVRASVEDIPDYRVRTPLQTAVMILKRHRDHTFEGRPEVRPISVVLTTLAAHAYNGEETIGPALVSILARMDQYVVHDGRKYVIPNPTDPLENFADKWAEHPERADAFFEWLERARAEFGAAAVLVERQSIADTVAKGVGRGPAERARARRRTGASLLRTASAAPAASSTAFAFPNERRASTKPQGFA